MRHISVMNGAVLRFTSNPIRPVEIRIMLNPQLIPGMISILVMIVTLILLLMERKEGGLSFLALAMYFLLLIFANLFYTGLFQPGSKVFQYTRMAASLLDAPLMLIAARYFTSDGNTRKVLLQLSGAYLLFELVVCLLAPPGSVLMICIGPGLVLVIGYAFSFFYKHVETSFIRSKERGKAFMSGSLVFAYACFSFMYIVHYLLRDKNFSDLLRIYQLTLIIFSVAMTLGLVMISRDRRKKTVAEPKLMKQDDKNPFQYL